MLILMRLVVVLGGILFMHFWGCAPPAVRELLLPGEPFPFQERQITDPLRDDGERTSLEQALERSLAYLAQKISGGKSSAQQGNSSNRLFRPEAIYRTLTLFREVLSSSTSVEELERKIRENFTFWEAARNGRESPILLTGYYEPIVEGNTRPVGDFKYPLYRRPDDLVAAASGSKALGPSGQNRKERLENGEYLPYYSRREIDSQGVLQGKGYELVWLKDPWERFLLHVQGSGKIRLPDGETLRVGFAASNGRPYRSIGRVLAERGFLDRSELSLRKVKEFLHQNPGLMEEIFNANERYIFFRILPDAEGAMGSHGFSLTAGRSIATDPAVYPPGALAYIISEQPVLDGDGKVQGRRTLQRFVFHQDTGAALKGPSRVDLFFGSGEEAGAAAGEMREEGRIYLLLAK